MNVEEYKAMRNALLAQVHEYQDSGDAEKMNDVMDKIEALDTEFHDAAVNAANMRAMTAESGIVDLKNMSRPVTGGKVVETMDNKIVTEYTADSKEYRSAFLKNLQGKTLTDVETKAFNATAVSAPGAIPTETVKKIYGRMADSPLIAAVNLMFIPGNVQIPVEGTINDANWVPMANAATDSADTLSVISLGAYKLIKTVEITADLAAMAIDEFEVWLVDSLAKKLRFAVDKAICTGDGTNQATGILHSGAVTNTGEFTMAGMTYKDLLKIIAALPTQWLPGASFAMPRALFFGEVLGLTDADGKPVCVLDPQAPAKYNVLGYPVIVDDNITTDNLIFGDFREGYTFNFAKAPTVESDKSVGFRTGSTVYRGMALADGKVVVKDAFTVYKRASS